MKDDTEYISSDNNALLTLIDRVDLISELDFIVIDYPDCMTPMSMIVTDDNPDLLEFEF